MSNKSKESVQQKERPGTEGGDGLVLPDESDGIIEDLKSQLQSLQGELAQYRQEETAGSGDASIPPRAAPTTTGETPDDWDATFAPRIVSRLQGPTEELTARLERLIEQVQDPDLRQELEHCQQTAFYLFDTFRQVSDNHHALMASLSDEEPMLEPAVFAEAVRSELATAATGAKVEDALAPESGGLPHSALVVVKTLARVALQLIGEVESVRIESDEVGGICVTLACSASRDGLEQVESPSQVVFKPGVSAITVVDWLYMEKIVELRGGAVTLHHIDKRAAGFQIRLPGAPDARGAR